MTNTIRAIAILAVTIATAIVSPAIAGEAHLAAERGPHYVGEPFAIQVVATGFDEKPEPEVTLGDIPEGLRVTYLGVAPMVSSSVTIINGRRSESRDVKFRYSYRVTPSKAGAFTIPAAIVTQDGKSVTTNPLRVSISQIDEDPDMRIELILPDGPVYPRQRAKIRIRWWYAGNLDEISQMLIYSPLFDEFDFEDEPIRRGGNALSITGANGGMRIRAEVDEQTLNGTKYLVATAERTMLVDQVGTYSLEPIVATVNKVNRWRQDMFGRRVPAGTKRMRAAGDKAELVVKPLPMEGRPESFTGAVGSGFSLSARASNTVVKVGDPIKLTLTLHGDARFDTTSMGPLFADGEGLDPNLFATESEPFSTEGHGDGKMFKFNIRVLEGSVGQIPPIPFSWFDPELGRYQTTRSNPIALQVAMAQTVGAADVVSARSAAVDEDEELLQQQTAAPRVRDFDISGADLTIVNDPQLLGTDEADRFGGRATLATVYGGSLLLIAAMFALGRRAAVDPKILAARKAIREQTSRLSKAGKLTAGEQAAEIAAALRALAPHVKPDKRAELDRIVLECDSLAFAPDGGQSGDCQNLYERAVALAKEVR